MTVDIASRRREAPARLVDVLENMRMKTPQDYMARVRQQENAEDLGKSSLARTGMEAVA